MKKCKKYLKNSYFVKNVRGKFHLFLLAVFRVYML